MNVKRRQVEALHKLAAQLDILLKHMCAVAESAVTPQIVCGHIGRFKLDFAIVTGATYQQLNSRLNYKEEEGYQYHGKPYQSEIANRYVVQVMIRPHSNPDFFPAWAQNLVVRV